MLKLVSELEDTYLSTYYVEELFDEIKARTQGRNGPIAIYIASMQNLFNPVSTHRQRLVKNY